MVLVEQDGGQARRFFVDRERRERASLGDIQSFGRAGNEFEHCREVVLGQLLEPVADSVAFIPLPVS